MEEHRNDTQQPVPVSPIGVQSEYDTDGSSDDSPREGHRFRSGPRCPTERRDHDGNETDEHHRRPVENESPHEIAIVRNQVVLEIPRVRFTDRGWQACREDAGVVVPTVLVELPVSILRVVLDRSIVVYPVGPTTTANSSWERPGYRSALARKEGISKNFRFQFSRQPRRTEGSFSP